MRAPCLPRPEVSTSWPERRRRDSRRRARPQLAPSRQAVASHSPLPAACQRRPLNPVARALAGPKSARGLGLGTRWVGKKSPRFPCEALLPQPLTPGAKRLQPPARPGHTPVARAAVAASSPSPSTPAPLGPETCYRSRPREGGTGCPPGAVFKELSRAKLQTDPHTLRAIFHFVPCKQVQLHNQTSGNVHACVCCLPVLGMYCVLTPVLHEGIGRWCQASHAAL